MADIVVVGSINMDIVNHVERYPLPGETIKGLGTDYVPGGKGANQGVAASLAGGAVAMIGAVGQDAFGEDLVAALNRSGIHIEFILKKETASGLAFITVDRTGENRIILSAGSNGSLSANDVQTNFALLKGAKILLVQNEIPWETTSFAIEEAYRRGIRVIFNPSPALSVPTEILSLVDTIILNETEAGEMTGFNIDEDSQLLSAMQTLIREGVRRVVLTLGEKGSLFLDKQGTIMRVPAFQVTPVDTTAAGDTFIGAYAVATMRDISSEESLRFASAAAALAVTRKGAQSSIPNLAEIEEFLSSN